jgi:DNA polymerase-3 subunit delta'
MPAPRANPTLVGHGAAERTLLDAFGSGRLPHAWLITGPRGVGKATLAYRFARFVLAEGGAGQGQGQGPALLEAPPASLDLDPEGPVFRRVAAGAYPDLRTLEPAVDEKTGKRRRVTAVGQAREIGGFLRMTAGEGGWRIVVADPVDALNRSAAHALLKILEEPPARALLLLVSHAPGGLLPTIRSRCCHLALTPLPEATVVELLGRYAPGIPAEERTALARLSEGSVGRALELAETGGLELYRELVELVGGLPHLDVPRVHALGDRLTRGGDGTAFRTALELLAWWLARTIRAAAEGRTPPEAVPGEAAATRLVDPRALARWLALWEKIARLPAQVEGANLDRKQAVITAFLDFEAAASA